MSQTAVAYCRMATTYIRESELDNAENAALTAEQRVLIIRGTLFARKGELREAYQIYTKALDMAQRLDNAELIALSHARLSSIQIRRDQFDNAV